MPRKRSSKARNQVKGDKTGAPWFQHNNARSRARKKMAKASRKKNRG